MQQRHQSPPDIKTQSHTHEPVARTLRGLDWLNFFLADVQTGLGPFLAIYLAAKHWNEQSVGWALTVGGIAGILTQTPAGAIVDRVRAKRTIIVLGIGALIAGALLIAFWPGLGPVLAAQMLIGGMSSLFAPAVAAISLGVVGSRAFDQRQGRNQTFNSAGNVTAAVAMGLIGYYLTDRSIYFFVIAMTVPALLSLSFINPREIDYNQARGYNPENASKSEDRRPVGILDLLRNHRLAIFVLCCVLFHFANAAMLPLLGEMLSRGKGKSSMAFMSACVVTTQLVVTLIAAWCGRLASTRGRKAILLVGFAALPIRGLLYTLTGNVFLLISIQLLDGLAAAIFGVVSLLVIADLTRGTGRFNLAQGLLATAVGIGASLSQLIAGAIVHHSSYRIGFLFLAAVAAGALIIFATLMPETKDFQHSP